MGGKTGRGYHLRWEKNWGPQKGGELVGDRIGRTPGFSGCPRGAPREGGSPTKTFFRGGGREKNL